MEGMEMNQAFWHNRSVFLTGHTGFKGGWLALWLHRLGARVHGLSLAPPTVPNFFATATVTDFLAASTIADIRDLAAVEGALERARPSVVIHMAAQPLVRESYASPVDTYATNVIGTAHILEAVRRVEGVAAVILVTTDKCYENLEWEYPYRENDRLGGYDPYSSSKACAELVAVSYRRSFLAQHGVGVSTVRAGNVIGGGDWSTDRLLPDFFRALDSGLPLEVRSPSAVRPWQHVLEPLSGYITLAEALVRDAPAHADSWNFGPDDSDAKPVGWILEKLMQECGNLVLHSPASTQPHESRVLKLDSSRAKARLGWRSRWPLEHSLLKTVEWHRAWRKGQRLADVCLAQIDEYVCA